MRTARGNGRRRRRGALAEPQCLAAFAAALAIVHPVPSAAGVDVARSPAPTSAVERALTGGIVTLRAPGSRMIRVAASRFAFGSSLREIIEATADCAREPLGHRCNERTFSNERPRTLAFAPSFWLDRAEVTVGAYRRCFAAGACTQRALVGGERRLDAAALPVTLVTAGEAERYCRARGARLPSEAELERAARGAGGRRYPWGELYNARLANHGRLGLDPSDAIDGFEELAPAGSFVGGRTPDGFLDLAGNAAEWTTTPYGEQHGLEPDPSATSLRVVKGGHFLAAAPWLRGAARQPLEASDRLPTVGFRCARSAPGAR